MLIGRELKRRHPWRPLPGPQTMAFESDADVIGYGGAAGGGKGLALDTRLPTPTGWTTMGVVAVGDWLLDERGQPCRVTAVSELSHRPCYRVTFDDKSSLVADDVHRWLTFDAKELHQLTKADPAWQAARRAKRPSRAKGTRSEAFTQGLAARNAQRAKAGPPPTGSVRDTQAIADTLLTIQGRRNHAIPVQGALALPDADLPIDPYVLGVWLGDGSSANGNVTGIDDEIWPFVEAAGYEVSHSEKDAKHHCVLGLKVQLRALGVLGAKHVPAAYLRGSYAQRLALLQGLMDTDGHAALDGGCEFDNTNGKLIDAAYELAVSLGLKATITEGRAKVNGKDCGPRWRVKFTTDLPVFRLSRKLARLKPCRRTTRFRYVVACEPVASVPTKCIAVDSPTRLYLAGYAMVPTHNTDLACGKTLTQHRKIMILRRVGTELTGIEDRLEELIGDRKGYNSQKKIWRHRTYDGRNLQIELASVPNADDEKGYQGRPHDLLIFDEAANFLEAQVRFLMGWVRTTIPGQKCQTLMTFNPPTTAEGRWIVDFFAPWLDPKHPDPAKPGELRWFATIDGREVECHSGETFDWKGETITPKSRTFIPSRIRDNPFLMGTGYMSTLQALPEPLRSQMLNGDFMAGVKDDPWQVIPTAWVDLAMARWKPRNVKPKMTSMGVDVARGGDDQTVIARRHDNWYDELLTYEGKETPDGQTVAAQVISNLRDSAPIHIDVIGVGASPYDQLRQLRQQVIGVNVSERAYGADKSGRLRFPNQRSELWWRMREALDPQNNTGIELPYDTKLKADLCAPKWELRSSTIYVESREQIYERIKRSPDRASALILAALDTPCEADLRGIHNGRRGGDYDPYE